jgi:hypothetical protein
MKRVLKSRSLVAVAPFFFATLLLAVLAFSCHSAPSTNDKETLEDVIRVGRAAGPALNSIVAAVKDSQAIADRMEDRAFATKVLELAKKNDKQRLADLFKGVAPNSQITIKEISDFWVAFGLQTPDGHSYELCIGDGCTHPSGAKGQGVVFSQLK